MNTLNDCSCGSKFMVGKTMKRDNHTLRLLVCECGAMKHTLEVAFNPTHKTVALPAGYRLPDGVTTAQPYNDIELASLDDRLAEIEELEQEE